MDPVFLGGSFSWVVLSVPIFPPFSFFFVLTSFSPSFISHMNC